MACIQWGKNFPGGIRSHWATTESPDIRRAIAATTMEATCSAAPNLPRIRAMGAVHLACNHRLELTRIEDFLDLNSFRQSRMLVLCGQ